MTVTVFKEVTSDCVKLSNGEDLPCGLVVWSTGLSPTQFVKSQGGQEQKWAGTRSRIIQPLIHIEIV